MIGIKSLKIAFHTLGCKVNMYETEALAGLFKSRGYKVTDFGEYSDIYVINTCTVTAVGDKKSRQIVRRAKRINPEAIVAVIGCYAQVAAQEVEKIEGVDIVLGNGDKGRLIDIIENHRKQNLVSEIGEEYEELALSEYFGKTRVTLKIQDGCNNFCSYCIIPYARGRVRSRLADNIVKEAENVAKKGFSEVVLTGIHLCSYGTDLGGITLLDVLKMVHEVEGIRRIRLGSLEPGILTERFVNEISRLPKICPHFHVSLQSGCDETLKRMRRRYTFDEYLKGITRLKAIEDCAVTTDVIVGFPMETDREFEQSLENIKRCGFADIHVFPYSKRKGTDAATMEGQLDDGIKQKRVKMVMEIAKQQKREFLKRYIGRNVEVLFEENGQGYTANYIRVSAVGGVGMQQVAVRAVKDDMLEGELL